jgi:chorismate synthase
VGILEGLPAGLPLEPGDLDRDLARRQLGFGRGGRMRIETDRAEILAGVRFARTLGSPLAILIRNKDFANWTERMKVEGGGPDPRPILVPRPGHADLTGGLKYGHAEDLRNILERASARETATRVALGGAAKALLRELGIGVGSYVRSIGGVEAIGAEEAAPELWRTDAEGLAWLADASEVRVLDEASTQKLSDRIREAQKRRDTLGGVVEVVVTGLPIGLGSHIQWDRKLDGRLAQAAMSVHAIKAVEIGDGWLGATRFGSEVHDPIFLRDGRLVRSQNRAGGLEGGITNGEPLIVRAAMKPIATVSAALPSVKLDDLSAVPAHVERSDTCAVPAAGVVVEAMVALTLADALIESLGGDTLEGLRLPFARYRLASRSELGHLFLIGPMGAGKTSVGQALARSLGRPWVDLDGRVEKAQGASVAKLFETLGEAGFRKQEEDALKAVCGEGPSVVGLGGGAALTETAWRLMRNAGVTVLLTASARELARRIQSGNRPLADRPLLAGGDPEEKLKELLRVRDRWYRRADLHLDTEGMSVTECAGAVRGLLMAVRGPLPRAVGKTS